MDKLTPRFTKNENPNMDTDTRRITKNRKRKKGRPIKPEILKKLQFIRIRSGVRIHMALDHYAKQRHISKSELVRMALEHYFTKEIPKMKWARRQIEKKVYVDYRKRPIVDYQFAFSDDIEIPDLIQEEFDDYFDDTDI